jgi:cbb3-type cytochrome oxidase maturation protein
LSGRRSSGFTRTNLNGPNINMTIIILLIGISLTIAIAFLAVFFWSIKSGQYDDTYTPSVRMLFDDKSKKESVKPGKK